MKLNLRYVLSAAAFGLLVLGTGCNKDDGPSEAPVPTVSVTAGVATENSISFDVVPRNADTCAYICVKEGGNAPTAAQVFADGKGIAARTGTVTASYLENNTSYTVYVAARNGKVLSETAHTTMKTGEAAVKLSASSDKKNAYSYTIASEGSYLYGSYSKYFWEKEVGEGATQAAMKAYLEANGQLGNGGTDNTVTDGMKGPGGKTVEVLGGMEYVVAAAQCDNKGQIVGPVFTETVKTLDMGHSSAEITIGVSDITAKSAKTTCTPDAGIDRYYVVFDKTANVEDYVAKHGTAGWKEYILGTGTVVRGVQETVRTMETGTSYTLAVVGIDKSMDSTSLFSSEIVPENIAPTLSIKLYLDTQGENTPYNSVFADIKATHSEAVKYFFVNTSAIEPLLAQGATYEQIVLANGYDIPDDMLEKLNSDKGAGLVFGNGQLTPKTAYTLIMWAQSASGQTVTEHAEQTTDAKEETPPVESDLFTQLIGQWTAKMKDSEGVEVTFPVEIASGVNEETSEAYRAENRLVCLGFGASKDLATYYSPEALLEEEYWQQNPAAAYTDYGPKWFLQIDKGDVVTVPADVKAGTLIDIYNDGPFYLLGVSGTTLISGGQSFDVTVSADKNTLTVKGYQAKDNSNVTKTFYPSVLQKADKWYLVFSGGSDITLTRSASSGLVGLAQSGTVMKNVKQGLRSIEFSRPGESKIQPIQFR